MAKPLVSVLMPVYNPHPLYFRQAVESILNQTLPDWELVIVEDPSTRSAADLLNDFADPRIRHFVNPHRTSLVAQLNRCLQEARAELVACQDADDISEPDRLEKQVAFMEAHPEVTVLGTQLAVIDGNDRLLGYRRYPCEHDAILAAMPRFNPIANPSVMFRRRAVLEAGGYQYAKFPKVEDYDLWCRLAKQGARFANLPDALVRYRVEWERMAGKTSGTLQGTLEIKRRYWGAEMDARARLRWWAERALLWLPPRLIVWLFLKTQLVPPHKFVPAKSEVTGYELRINAGDDSGWRRRKG